MNHPPYANASLYIGDLNNDVTETHLFDIFKQAGPVASIRVCRDAVTRRSLGYAYVNYHNVEDAERALDLLNYKDIKGRPCRIMWSQRDPALRKSNLGNIFIKNLHKSIDNKALYDTFATFGNILSCKVATDENGNSKGYGFIHYDSNEAAEKSVNLVNGKLLNGKKCFVAHFVPRKDRSIDPELRNKWTNIYIKYLDKSINTDKLHQMFEKFGKITSCVVMSDDKGESKGFGFINYEANEEASAAVNEMNGKDIEGKQLYVGRAQKKSEREKELKELFSKIQQERMNKYQGVNLYVKNLDDTVDDEKLRQEFSQFGTITSAKIMSDEKKNSKGFGFVCFSTPEEATKAVTEMNGKLISGKPIYVALAQRKEQRRQQLEAQYQARMNGIRLQQQAQAAGMTGSPIYPGPMFFPPGGRGLIIPTMIPTRGRFPPNMRGGPQGYMGHPFVGVPQQGQGGRGMSRGRGGPKGQGPSRGGSQVGPSQGYPMNIKYNPNVRNQQLPVSVPTETVPVQSVAPEDRKQQIGEQIYPLIGQILRQSNQDDLTGKVTGMFLESIDQVELMQMLDSPESLAKKVQEAIDVLAAHAAESVKTNN